MSPVMTIFELKPRRVRNIFICSGLVFCASSRITNESLSVRPRMKASGATSITLRSRWVATFSGSIMSCSASNSGRRYGSIFAIRSPGRKPRRSPASTAGRVRMIRLTSRRLSAAAAIATARKVLPVPAGPIAEGDRVAADRVDVALLVDGLGRDPRRAMAPDDVLEDLGRRLVLVERVGHRGDRALGDLVALLDEVRQLAHDDRGGGHRLGLAVERDDVAAQEQLAVDVALERAQDLVVGAAQRGGDLVGELELAAHQRAAPPGPAPRRACRRRGRRRAPSRLHDLAHVLGRARRPVSATASARSRAARRRRARPAGRPR